MTATNMQQYVHTGGGRKEKKKGGRGAEGERSTRKVAGAGGCSVGVGEVGHKIGAKQTRACLGGAGNKSVKACGMLT